MAPHGKAIITTSTTFSRPMTKKNGSLSKPPRLSSEGLHRTVSDISFKLMSKEEMMGFDDDDELPPISEVEDAKCECCGMVEECTPEYIERVRDKYLGKWVCGLCSEAVNEELQKSGGGADIEQALAAHVSACVRFNKFGRAYPVLFQAEAMREMLKKSKNDGRNIRAKSISPRDMKANNNKNNKKGAIARSSSCIPAITRDFKDLTITS